MEFDENFFNEVGMGHLSEVEKQAFIEHTRAEMEMRVGEQMIKGLTTDQVQEFEGIMKNDQQVIRKVVAELGQDFRNDEVYQKVLQKHGVSEGTWEIIGEYLSIKWIQKNRPDYKDIVSSVFEGLKQEIIAGNQQAPAAPIAPAMA